MWFYNFKYVLCDFVVGGVIYNNVFVFVVWSDVGEIVIVVFDF